MVPSVRGSVVLSQLEHLDALPKPERDRLLSEVAPKVLAELRQVGRLEWLELSKWMDLATPMMLAAGPEEYRTFWRRVQIEMVEQPVFKSIVAGSVRVFGLSPSTFCKVVPTAQSLVFRDVGTFSVTVIDDKHARIDWVSVPKEVLAHEPMAVGFSGAFSSFFDLCKTQGTLTLTRTPQAITFELGWK